MTARLSLPRALRKRGAALLDQQMWLFGCDIRRAQGNALLEYGFQRIRPPEAERSSSRYELRRSDGRFIFLWAFGIYFSEAESPGLFLRRYEFSPRLMDAPGPAWKPEDLPPPRLPVSQAENDQVRALLQNALRWLADYERWALKRLGIPYRAACLAAWPKRVTSSPEETPQAWRELAQACEPLKTRSLSFQAAKDSGPWSSQ